MLPFEGFEEQFIASDIMALSNITNKFKFMDDGQIAILDKDKIAVTSSSGVAAKLKTQEVDSNAYTNDLKGYSHFMEKEIFEQSNVIKNSLEGRLAKNESQEGIFGHIIPISALKGLGIEDLLTAICKNLPEGVHLFPKDQVTDISEKFLASEIIREKCINRLGDELPYRISVSIERFSELEKITHIDSTIFVEKQSQKGMLIGKSGSQLKAIGTASRKELEKLLDTKVMLKTWVKVKSGWSDNESLLSSLGYDLDK